MTTIWQSPPAERLKDWRKLRHHLMDIDDDEQVLDELIEWWKYAPMAARVIDPYDFETWPDPWELIHNDLYDENVVTLGMAYTLELIDWPCELLLVQCNEKNEIKLVLVVDDTVVLNYNYANIDSLDSINHCEILDRWESDQLTQ